SISQAGPAPGTSANSPRIAFVWWNEPGGVQSPASAIGAANSRTAPIRTLNVRISISLYAVGEKPYADLACRATCQARNRDAATIHVARVSEARPGIRALYRRPRCPGAAFGLTRATCLVAGAGFSRDAPARISRQWCESITAEAGSYRSRAGSRSVGA